MNRHNLSQKMNAIARNAGKKLDEKEKGKRINFVPPQLRPVVKKAVIVKKGAEAKLQNTGKTMRKSVVELKTFVKKNGFNPMNDKGIIGDAPEKMRAMKAKKKAEEDQLKAIHKRAAKQ